MYIGHNLNYWRRVVGPRKNKQEHMKQKSGQLKAQDVLVLLKLLALGSESWQQKTLAASLGISQSEISQALARLQYAGLLMGKEIMRSAFLDFLQYGIAYVFPQRPGATVRGIATAHSAPPIREIIDSRECYVWPFAKGDIRGQSVEPIYPSVPEAAVHDKSLYELLALTDALRVGKSREKKIAIDELRKRFSLESQ
jgi:hypothetical protein